MMHLGNVDAGSTLYIPFTSYDSNGASITLTGLAVTDIEIYKNGSVTQRSSDAGYALLDTDGIDFDGITGLHGFSIDLADDTDTGFYAAGSFYWVVVSAVTIDTRTVNFVAATFKIGPAAANVTQFAGTAITSAAGIPEVKVASLAANAITATAIAADAITAAKVADGTIDAATFAAGAINAAAIASDAITDAKVAADVTIASVTGAVGSVTGNVGGNVTGSVGSVAAGGIAAASFAAGAIDAAAIAANAIGASELAADAATEIADAILNRDMSAVADTTARSPLNALRFLRNKWSISGTTLTVCEEDDTTTAWTSTVTGTAGADPVTASDPG